MSPLNYQWHFSAGALVAATSRSLALTNIQSAQAGSYAVVVTDSSGSVTSRVAQLVVDATFTKITIGDIVTGKGSFQATGWADYEQGSVLTSDTTRPPWHPSRGRRSQFLLSDCYRR